METLKGVVATLTAVLIFISAVEIIAPDNKMKKYISFVLGLILISVILNPIIKLISNGEKSIEEGIRSYESVFNQNSQSQTLNTDESISFESNIDNDEARKKAFIKNFNKNCESLLKNKYKDKDFKSDIDCDVDFKNININIKKLRIGIHDKNVQKVKKIQIGGSTENSDDENLNDEYSELINFVSSELNVQKEKIEVYRLDEKEVN